MSRRSSLLLALLGLAAVLHGTAPARAGDQIPFTITSSQPRLVMECYGPWQRLSGCTKIPNPRQAGYTFYTAENNLFSPVGTWVCKAFFANSCPGPQRVLASVEFCWRGVGEDPPQVDLVHDGSSLTVNQPSSCFGAPIVARSVLGQTGEADGTPAEDRDTYVFAGNSAEAVEVTLDRDGSTGSAGAVATLRLRTPGGAVLGEATGPVPLRLKATLPGEVEILVLRDGNAGNALRGGYELGVLTGSDAVDGRALRPTANVEG